GRRGWRWRGLGMGRGCEGEGRKDGQGVCDRGACDPSARTRSSSRSTWLTDHDCTPLKPLGTLRKWAPEPPCATPKPPKSAQVSSSQLRRKLPTFDGTGRGNSPTMGRRGAAWSQGERR